MKWLTVVDYGGFGDTLATAVALSAFRNSGIKIAYVTRLWDDTTLMQCVGPYWDYLCSADPHSPPTTDELGLEILRRSDWVVNFTPFNTEGLGNFYSARVTKIAKVTGIVPGPLDPRPIKRMGMPRWRFSERMLVIHPFSAWEHKFIPEDDYVAIARTASDKGLTPVFLGNQDQGTPLIRSHWHLLGAPLAEVIPVVFNAFHCICADSCISHIAYWMGKRAHVFYRGSDAGLLLGKMPNAPFVVARSPLNMSLLWEEINP